MKVESKQEIFKRRREIEQELFDLLKKTKSDFTLNDVKDVIYNEEGQNDLTQTVKMFDTGESFEELSNILETLNDAWNYFPHRILGGLSPAEKILEYQESKK